jgi:uncharacterized membrane protein (UPF0127 family)
MKLYGISVEDVRLTIEQADNVEQQEDGLLAATKLFGSPRGDFPLKVVYVEENERLVVVTAYPLKRREWRTP